MSEYDLFKGVKTDNVIDIYELFNGNKDSLVLPGRTDPYQLHHEAYEENKYIATILNKHSNYLVVTMLEHPTLLEIANHLISVLMYGDHEFVTYKGLYKTSSLRAAAYKISKDFDVKINANLQLGMLYISIKKDKVNMADKMKNVDEGETVRIPISLFNTAAKFRAALQSYSLSTGFKFKTRIEGLNMVVTRLDLTNEGLPTMDRLKMFVNQLEWDMTVCLNPLDFPGMKPETIRSNLYRLSGNTITCIDNNVTKRSKKISKVNGMFCLIYKGTVLYQIPHADFNETEQIVVNKLLEPYGLTFTDFNY